MKKSIIVVLIILAVIILGGCTLVRILNYKINTPEAVLNIGRQLQPLAPQIIRRKIDGMAVASPVGANLYPVAVMIENAADSWPQTGLDKANLVIEAITEASIPRFVAIYASNDEIKRIGPVRSARIYYLDWIEPFKPLYMHVGGAPEALQKIRSGNYGLVNLDQFFNDQYYWRDKWRYAPHNVYTSSELIKQALADKNLNTPTDYQTWTYKTDLELDKRPNQVNDIAITYAPQYYKVRWVYNRDENDYIRYQNNEIHKMSDGEWIKAKNIIVQVNAMSVIDDVGRKKIITIGSGKAWVFRDGETTTGQWKKDNIKSIVKYYDNDGKEIELNGGTTWIEVIPNEDYLRS